MDLTLSLDKNNWNQRPEGVIDCHFLMVELIGIYHNFAFQMLIMFMKVRKLNKQRMNKIINNFPQTEDILFYH